MRQLTVVTGKCRITTLELRSCELNGHKLAGVLEQWPAMDHLDLSDNDIHVTGARRISAVLAQCRALSHLNLSYNYIGPAGAESFAGVLEPYTGLTHLNLSHNNIRAVGSNLPELLVQWPALTYLDLSGNQIGAAGTQSVTGVLTQCTDSSRSHLESDWSRWNRESSKSVGALSQLYFFLFVICLVDSQQERATYCTHTVW